MAEARDSGISVDNDCDSLSSATSSSRDFQQLSFVQRLRKRFEILATEKINEFHTECNWWLTEEEQHRNDETKIYDVRNTFLTRNTSTDSEIKSYSQQSSIKSESVSIEHKFTVTPATPVRSPSTPMEFPGVTFKDFPENNETNDSDSFDDDSEVEEAEAAVENGDEEEVLAEEYLRNSRNSMKLIRPISTASQISNVSSSKLYNIVRELIENEENYCRSLRAGIENYMKVFEHHELPKTLRGQKYRIFANIKSIYTFHEFEFLPSLVQCNDDPEQIAEVFKSFVSRDFFYGYIIYAINRKRSELLCNYHVDFWKKVQNECGDRLGINSFLLQPIQRLPRYALLMNEIIKDLSKDLENTKQAIAACCVAEKNIQRLLDSVNESMSINDIRNCYEVDILCQGKFKKMDEFDIYDWEIRRRFRGKVFLFERCVIYTEALDREYMEYRGHFSSDKLGIIYKEGKSKFKLFTKKRGQKEVEFRAPVNTVIEWNEIIMGMLMKFVIEEKKKNVSNSRKNSCVMMPPVVVTENSQLRSSVISTRSDQSNYSISSYRSSSGNSSLGRDSMEPRKSQWYI